MKLSFSTKGWRGYGWQEYLDMAKEFGFGGVELHNIRDEAFIGASGPMLLSSVSKTLRQLIDMELKIPCIDAVCDIADGGDAKQIEGTGKASTFYLTSMRITSD